ncbi:hypothetical protein [Psychroflexus salarius]|nr:hypothetical protein [Psychroflexus salarius]
MKKTILLSISLLIMNFVTSQNINTYLDKYKLYPNMISQHSDGEWFLSTKPIESGTPELVKITPVSRTEAKIDTLDYGFYLNISKLSNDGDHLLYAFADTIQDVRKTYMRPYKNGELGEPTDFRAFTGLESLTYFMVDKDDNVYFYSYSKSPKGIYLVLKQKDGKYSEAKLLIPKRPDLVPFSPLLLDKSTMLMAMHGEDDQSTNGIYVSKKTDNTWAKPIKIEDMPYGWSLGFDSDGNLIYINAKTRRIERYSQNTIRKAIDKTI